MKWRVAKAQSVKCHKECQAELEVSAWGSSSVEVSMVVGIGIKG